MRPGSRVVTSWNSHVLPSGPLGSVDVRHGDDLDLELHVDFPTPVLPLASCTSVALMSASSWALGRPRLVPVSVRPSSVTSALAHRARQGPGSNPGSRGQVHGSDLASAAPCPSRAALGGPGPQTSSATAFVRRNGCLQPLWTSTSTAARRETAAGRLRPLWTQTSSANHDTTGDGRLRAPPVTLPAPGAARTRYRAHAWTPSRSTTPAARDPTAAIDSICKGLAGCTTRPCRWSNRNR